MAENSESNERELRQRINAGSQNLDDHLDLADLLIRAGEVDSALAVYHQALDLALSNTERATILFKSGDLLFSVYRNQEQARLMADRCLSILSNEDDTPEVLQLRGSCHSLIAFCIWESDPKARVEAVTALECFQRVISLCLNDEATEGALLGGGRTCVLIIEIESAIAHYNDYLQRDLSERARLLALLELASCYRMHSRLAEAEQTANAAIRYASSDSKLQAQLYLELGLIYRGQKRLSEATQILKEALPHLQQGRMSTADHETLIDACLCLADLLLESGDAAAASEQCRLIFDSLGCVSETYRTGTLLGLGHHKMAAAEYESASALYRDLLSSPSATEEQKRIAHQNVLFLEAQRLYDSYEFEEARSAYLKALAYHPIDEEMRKAILLLFSSS